MGWAAMASAQVDWGLRAGINYGAGTSITNATWENKAGWHGGVFMRAKVPVLGLYVQPEAIFTQTKAGVRIDGQGHSDLSLTRFDVPVMVGFRMLQVFRVYAGPTFMTPIHNDSSVGDIVGANFSAGGDIGIGLDLGPILVDARFQSGFGDQMVELRTDNGSAHMDLRPNQWTLSLGWYF